MLSITDIYISGFQANVSRQYWAARAASGKKSLGPRSLFGTVQAATLQVYPQQYEVGWRDPANATRLSKGPGPKLR